MSITYDAGGRRVAETDALGHTTRYQYDDLGRVTDTIFHDGSRTQVAYDELGRRTSMTDPEGYTTTYQYDALGRLTGVLDARGQLTQYRYDELGRLIEAEDANGQVTAYEYDRLGRRIAVELPLEQRSSMAYDAVGNMVAMTDFNGEVTAYGYDAQNRLILTDYEDDADVSYSYCGCGQLNSITDGRGITSYDYDHQGRLLSRQDPDGPYLSSGNTIEYSYDEAGNRTSVTTPNGSVTYGYDERNRLTTVLDDDLNLTTYTYDDANNLVRTVFPNDTVEIRGYDDLNRLVELKTVYVDPTTGAETVLTGFDYTLNQSGHRLAVTEADGRQVSYTYDELYRLTEENINNGERVLAYTYDSVGNRLTKDDSLVGLTTYTYDANDRLLSEVLTLDGVAIHTITYTYDDNGNLLSRTQVTDAASETTTYTWNDDDRLVAVATPDGSSVTYEYDEEGIRVSSMVDGVTTDYLVDKNRPYAQVLEELNSEQLQAFYVYGHDLIAQTRNTQQDFYQVDGLGSTRALTDENGNVTDTYDYEAFGELIESSGEGENSYRFAGEQFDEALGDYYLRQRFYDPSSGRFTRRDTYEGSVEEPSSLHKYLYANANPIAFTDPSGLVTKAQLLAAFEIADTLYTLASPDPLSLALLVASPPGVPTGFTKGLGKLFGGAVRGPLYATIAKGVARVGKVEPSASAARAFIAAKGFSPPFISDEYLRGLKSFLPARTVGKVVDFVSEGKNGLILVEAKSGLTTGQLANSINPGGKMVGTREALEAVYQRGDEVFPGIEKQIITATDLSKIRTGTTGELSKVPTGVPGEFQVYQKGAPAMPNGIPVFLQQL